MCAGYANTLTEEQLKLYFSVPGNLSAIQPRPSVRPTDPVPVVLEENGTRVLTEARWWLVPSWWTKRLHELPALFNARAETLTEKPSFLNAFKSRRCLIPATCFFEWSGTAGKKQKHVITRRDGAPLAFAGLWEEWRQPDGQALRSCTIITTTANEVMAAIHTRMPVILAASDWDEWLSPASPPAELQRLLTPCPAEWIEQRPVPRTPSAAAESSTPARLPLDWS